MLKLKILMYLFSLKVALCSNCQVEKNKSGFSIGNRAYQIKKLGELPEVVNESSGLAVAGSNTFWTHNDGGKTALYQITGNGTVTDTLLLKGIANKDWEDLAQDDKGNLYIGDFGNNTNQRKDLTIYKVHPSRPQHIEKITYSYSDQTQFPPDKENRNFDSEAFFWYADSLHLFSKNRGNNQVKLYSLPDQPGDYVAKVNEQIFIKNQVTAAAVNPGKTMFALLTYGKVLLFQLTDPKNLFASPYLCIRVARNQAEALVFVNETDFLITNEQGKVFLVEQKKQQD